MTQANYEILNIESIQGYLAADPDFAPYIDANSLVSCREIGDGNLNLVFIVEDAQGKSLVLKQSLPYVRMSGEGWPMTPERANREAYALLKEFQTDPEHTVSVYKHDPDQYVIAMEDLSSYAVWRAALIDGETHDGAAAQVGEFVARTGFATSVFAMDRFDYSRAITDTQNPDLCTITEDLVFTEPIFNIGRNEVLPQNEVDAAALAADPEFLAAMGVAKFRFMTHTESMIHGDLHTGSVMVRREPNGSTSVRVFDPEFAFYGPLAFDLGAVVANFSFAAARAFVLGDRARGEWCVQQTVELWDEFAKVFRELWAGRQNPTVWDDAFLEQQLRKWRKETALFASAKMARRIVGAAKVKDIESLEPELRAQAARKVLLTAREFARTWESIDSIETLTRVMLVQLA